MCCQTLNCTAVGTALLCHRTLYAVHCTVYSVHRTVYTALYDVLYAALYTVLYTAVHPAKEVIAVAVRCITLHRTAITALH